MIRITKLTDYGIVLMCHLAARPEQRFNAPDLAAEARLPLPMVSKILKRLARSGLLESHRGVHGGYSLARPAAEVSMLELIEALEGPLAMTECSEAVPGVCHSEAFCPASRNWRRISRAISEALSQVTLAEMGSDMGQPAGGRLVALGGLRAAR